MNMPTEDMKRAHPRYGIDNDGRLYVVPEAEDTGMVLAAFAVIAVSSFLLGVAAGMLVSLWGWPW